MTAESILADFSKRLISVALSGDRVKLVAARGVISPDDLSRLRENKEEIARLLGGWVDEPSQSFFVQQPTKWPNDSAVTLVVESGTWRQEVAGWPHARWKAWHDRVTATAPWGSTVDQIQAAERDAYRHIVSAAPTGRHHP